MNPLNLVPASYRMFAVGLIVVGLVVGLYGFGYSRGHKRASDAASAEKLAAVQHAIAQAQAIAKQDLEIASANIKTVEIIRDRTRTIRVKDSAHAKAHPLPADCVLDAERVRNLRTALAGTASADPGKPDYTVPAAARLGGQ